MALKCGNSECADLFEKRLLLISDWFDEKVTRILPCKLLGNRHVCCRPEMQDVDLVLQRIAPGT